MPKNEDPPPYEVATNKEFNSVPIASVSASVSPEPTTVVLGYSVTQYGPEPQITICTYCHARIKTTVKTEATSSTHMSALLLCCLCWPCACLPYFIDSCQNRNHYCPNCDAFLGTYGSSN